MTAPYRPFPNAFKQRLLAGETLIGCWCSLANPITTEVLGIAGFDWLLLDGEHSPNDVRTFIPQLMALKDSASAPIVRPSWNETVEIKRLLDAGFYNFLIPFVQTADDARRAVAATRYPPDGVRGVSVSQRSNRFGTVADYFRDVNAQICVPGADRKPRRPRRRCRDRRGRRRRRHLRRSVGPRRRVRPSRRARPSERAIGDRRDLRRRQGAGKPSGILTPVEADARRYLSMGARFVAVGSDLGVFRNATQQLRDRLRA
jgi:2-dehydro-3-deoxyglucarate aldolase